MQLIPASNPSKYFTISSHTRVPPLQISLQEHPPGFGSRGSTPELSLQSREITTPRESSGKSRSFPDRDRNLEPREGNRGIGAAGAAAQPQQEPGAPAAESWPPAGTGTLQRWILHPSLWLLEYLHKPQCALNPTTKSSQRAINILIPVAG